jgi:hypothetical protein
MDEPTVTDEAMTRAREKFEDSKNGAGRSWCQNGLPGGDCPQERVAVSVQDQRSAAVYAEEVRGCGRLHGQIVGLTTFLDNYATFWATGKAR